MVDVSDDAMGHLLHNILAAPAESGPPYTHTFSPLSPDPDEAVAWLREQIEDDKQAALIISNGGFAPERWDTDPPGQVNPERLTQAKAVDALLADDDPAFPLDGYWVALYAWERENDEPETARVRASDLPAAIVNDGRREADHIRRHDPLNTVADCEAKLAILDACLPDASMDEAVDNGDISAEEYVSTEAMGAIVLRLLAAGYRHRDGYARYWGTPPTHTLTEGES